MYHAKRLPSENDILVKEKYEADSDHFMRWLLYSIVGLVVISVGVMPSFAQSPNVYNVVDPMSGNSYPVNYTITGATVNDMSLDISQTSLTISLKTTGDGNLTITLPRTLIDAKAGANDDQFFVLVDGADTNFEESKTNTDRTLSIPFTVGSEKVEILGTQVVPEFGPLAFIILAMSVLSIVAISAKTRFRFRV